MISTLHPCLIISSNATVFEYYCKGYIPCSFKLVDGSSEDTLFKVLPSYKFQSEREKLVKFDDHVYLSSGSEITARNSFLYVDLKSSSANTNTANRPSLNNTAPQATLSNTETDDDDRILISLDKSSKLK